MHVHNQIHWRDELKGTEEYRFNDGVEENIDDDVMYADEEYGSGLDHLRTFSKEIILSTSGCVHMF